MEANWIESSLGKSVSDGLQAKADDWYTKLIIDNKVEQHLKYAFIPTIEQRQRSRGLENLGSGLWPYISNRIEAVMDMIYWMMRRMALMLLWLPACLPVTLCAALSGLCLRAIKKTNFDIASSVQLNYSIRGALVCTLLFLLSFLLPVALPPQIVPVVLVVVLVLLGWSTSNIAKRI